MSNTMSNPKSLYTFYYCYDHDDGVLVKGHLIPTGFNKCGCDICDWYAMGQITYDGTIVTVMSDVTISYIQFEGAFEFIYYASAYMDETGEFVTIPKDGALYKWMEAAQSSKNDIIRPTTNHVISTPPTEQNIGRISQNLPVIDDLICQPRIRQKNVRNPYGCLISGKYHSVVSFDLEYRINTRRAHQVKTMEIHYYSETHSYVVEKKYYNIEFDRKRMESDDRW